MCPRIEAALELARPSETVNLRVEFSSARKLVLELTPPAPERHAP
jgi:hypothetical protein